MTTPHAPNSFAWRILNLFGLATLALGYSLGFTVDLDVLIVLPVIGALLAVHFFYRTLRPNPAFAASTGVAAFFISCMLVMGPLSYIVVANGRPLMDADFAAIDAALGFDWRAVQRFTAQNWWLSKGGAWVYGWSGMQMILTWTVLIWTGQFHRLSIFLSALVLATGVVLIISGFMPAAGAYVHYGVAADQMGHLKGTGAGVWHLKHFTALRDGSLRHLVLAQSEGLITFPSFHTVVAVLAGWGLWQMRLWRWPMAVLSAAVISTTVPIGGHHLIDLFAGGLAAAAAVAVATGSDRTYAAAVVETGATGRRSVATRLVY